MTAPPRIQRFFIPGRQPGMNEILTWHAGAWVTKRGRSSVYTKRKRALYPVVAFHAQRHKVEPCTGPVHVRFEWREPDRRRDPDNIRAAAKIVLDALVDAGFLPGDSQRWIRSIKDTFEVDPTCPGVVVELEDAA